MIIPKVPKRLSFKSPDLPFWLDYDFNNLTFNSLDQYTEYALLLVSVGLREELADPSEIVYFAKAGDFLVRNTFDGRLVAYSREQFQKIYSNKI